VARKTSTAFPDDDNEGGTEGRQESGDTSFDPNNLERPAAENQSAAPDPFDPASLRLSHDLNANFGVKRALLSVPVRKPDKAWWVRVHPSEDYRLQTALVELKGDRSNESFLVAPALWPELATEATFRPKLLATAIDRQGTLFLWDVNLPRPDGRADEWSRTALEAVRLATAGWVRVTANLAAGCYDVFQATGQLTEPEWPDLPFREILRVAYKDRYIGDRDHLVLRKLRGEV
jgi:hypothetical protein